MRKNVKKQLALRVLSTAALLAMVSSIATAAFAEEYNVAKGSVEIVAENGSQSITQRDDKGAFVQDKLGKIDHREDSKIVLVTKDETTGETKSTSNTVTITAKDGNTANVTLKDVDIEVDTVDTKSGAIEIKGDGKTNLELNGDNTVLVQNNWSEEHAAIEKADKYGHGTLTITDDKNDDGSEKEKDKYGYSTGGNTGTLVAGGYHDAAAIGGGEGEFADTSNITITGGKITASGGTYGAGIGGGYAGDASNIRIEGNADVIAYGNSGAAIGSGYQSRGNSNSDITITDHATVTAAGLDGCGIGGGQDASGKVTITISGDASVNAQTRNTPAAIGNDHSSTTVNIKDNADVTAVGGGVAIGTGYGYTNTSTVINITGGTVNAVTRDDSRPAIGTVKGNLDLTINSSTGKTTVNTYTTSSDPLSLNIGTGHYDDSANKYRTSPSEGAEYNEDGSSNLGEDNAAIINFYRNTTLGTDTYDAPKTLDSSAFHATYKAYGTLYNAKYTLSDKDKGDLYKVVHNRKYMEEHPEIVDDINKLENSDLHDWQLKGEVVEPTLEENGYADYICRIDKCGQTKRVVLPKLTPEPSEPDVPGGNTPDTPNKPDTPKQPDGTTPAPVTPDTPVQDGTAPADTLAADTTADAAVAPAAAQNMVQDAKPEAAVAPANAQGAVQNAKPEAAAAAVLPQTGANWLAVVGTALSGMFLLAAGFVLDRKNRRMN